MYIRFVVHRNDEDSGRRLGLFHAITDLERKCVLLPHEKAPRDDLREWFNANLDRPRRFARSSKPHALNVAISWFKDTAHEHIANMFALARILEDHGVPVEVVRTERPGYIVYEDEFQVTAEPFAETRT